MKYLFVHGEESCFDLDEGTITAFSYAITDESLNILEHDTIYINPNVEENTYLGLNLDHLSKDKEFYYKQEKFPFYYETILNLINKADMVIGYCSDAVYLDLKSACKRYNLTFKDYDFIDLRDSYKEYKKSDDFIPLFAAIQNEKLSCKDYFTLDECVDYSIKLYKLLKDANIKFEKCTRK